MTCIALPQLCHEVTIKHGLSHLHLLVARYFVGATVVATGAEATNTGLVENLIFISLTVHVWKHVMDS